MTYFEGFEFFFLLVPVVLIGIFIRLRGLSIKPYALAVSLIFVGLIYASSPKALAYLLAYLTLEWININIFLGKRLEAKNQNTYRLALAVSLLPLVINKLSPVFGYNIFAFLGISYISFKAIQMVIEIQDGLIKEVKLSDYLSFMVFFPTMSSGPIDRSRRFEADINRVLERDAYLDMLGQGLLRFTYGYLYKFVISVAIYQVMVKCRVDSGLFRQVLYMYLYGFYLFFDFAGYSAMAVGVANALGLDIPMNFNMPFISQNIKDFWNRWHISLSTWFRDFVFSRVFKKIMKKKIFKTMLAMVALAYLIDMVTMGAWHGLTISYLAYGLYHGLLLAANEVYEAKSKFYKTNKDKPAYKALSTFLTFNLVMVGFFIFSGRLVDLINLYMGG